MAPQRNLSLLVGALFSSYLFSILLTAQEAHASSCPRKAPFVFREGDTLSEVLWFLGTEPVYGKRGWIEKTFDLNPALEKFRGKQIPPGTKVWIPIKLCPLKGGWTIESGELIAPYHHPTREKSVTQPDNDLSKTRIKEPISKPRALPAVKSTATPMAVQTVKPAPAQTPTPTPTPKPTPEATVPPIIAPSPLATPARPARTPQATPFTQTPIPSPAAAPQGASPMIVKTPPPKPPAKTKIEPIQKLRLDIKNSKETFEKVKEDEGSFLNDLKKDEDFIIE